MFKIKTLHENDWVSLREVQYPEKGINGYAFLHEVRCHGKIISILPHRKLQDYDGGSNNIEFLLREEVTPCWDVESPSLSTITGGHEGGDLKETARRELKEEAGYDVPLEDIIDLGTSRGTKSTDTTFHLYSVDLTGKGKGEAPGDGSRLEDEAKCVWLPELSGSQDPLAFAIFYKLRTNLLASRG